jgi:hypothetical protein
MTEKPDRHDLTQEQFAELTIALVRLIFDVEGDAGRQQQTRVHGRKRLSTPSTPGRPVQGPDDDEGVRT